MEQNHSLNARNQFMSQLSFYARNLHNVKRFSICACVTDYRPNLQAGSKQIVHLKQQTREINFTSKTQNMLFFGSCELLMIFS